MTATIIYIIGCFFATLICINEYLKLESKKDENKDYDDSDESEPQYGMSIVVIALSWVAVIAWLIGKFEKNKN